MTEPDVTLTDYGLVILCSWFAWNLCKHHTSSRQLQMLWIIFFSSVAVASLTGGTVHGFFLDESSLGYKVLWPCTLLALGITAASAWTLAGLLFSGSHKLRKWILFSAFIFFVYAGFIIFHSKSFIIAIINYIPALLTLLGVSVWRFRQSHNKFFLLIVYGILVSFAAAFIQQLGISIHPTYFNHNSTYHVIQGFGFFILYSGAKGLLTNAGIHQ